MTHANPPTVTKYNTAAGCYSEKVPNVFPIRFKLTESSSNKNNLHDQTPPNLLSTTSNLIATPQTTIIETKQLQNSYQQEELTEATTSKSYDVHFHNLLPSDYQLLIDTNWRRSGRHAYCPRNWDSCCPSLPIRLEVGRYKKRRDQRKVEAMMKDIMVLSGNIATDSNEFSYIRNNTCSVAHNSNLNMGQVITSETIKNTHTDTNRKKKMKQSGEVVGIKYTGLQGRKNFPTPVITTPGKWNQTPQYKFLPEQSTPNRSCNNDSNNDINKGGKSCKKSSWVKCMQIHAKSIVIKSNLLSKLGDTMVQVVRSVLEERQQRTLSITQQLHHQQQQQQPISCDEWALHLSLEKAVLDKIPTWCQFKIMQCQRPKLQKASKKEDMIKKVPIQQHLKTSSTTGCSTSDDVMVDRITIDMVATTFICAVLHGRSRGTIDKKDIGMAIVTSLHSKEYVDVIDRYCASVEEISAGGNRIEEVRLHSIEYHEKSGHVNFHLRVKFNWSICNSSVSNDDGKRICASDVSAASDGGIIHHSHSKLMASHKNKCGDSGSTKNGDANKGGSRNRRVDNILHEFVQKSNGRADGMQWQRQTTMQNDDTLPRPPLSDTIVPPYRITVRSVPAHISATQPEVHRLYTKYQAAIHGDADPFHEAAHSIPLKASPISQLNNNTCKVAMEGDEDDCAILESNNYISQGSLKPADFATFYPQYSDAQRRMIYKSYIAFYRFLCDSPFPRVAMTASKDNRSPPSTKHAFTIDGSTPSPTIPTSLKDVFQSDQEGYDTHIPYGFYHQQYRINDKHLLAVGVVDILPNCLSSVYAFYDPDLSRTLNLGKVTALREIEWVRRASLHRPSLRFYYLGFYIHSCPKMRYKAEYGPSELLCPVVGKWVDFEIAKERLEARSPIRHCCNLYSVDGVDNADDVGGISNDLLKKEVIHNRVGDPRSIGRNNTTNEELASRVLLDIKQSSTRFITALDLTAPGREMVLPFISKFVKEIGAELSRCCVIRWYR